MEKKQQGPSPRFQDLQYERGTNLHVKGIGGCCSPRLSRSQVKMLACEKCQTFRKSCVDVWRGHHSHHEICSTKSPPRSSSSPLDLKVFLWSEEAKIPQSFWWGGSSLYIGPLPLNQSQFKTDSRRWVPLKKIAKSNSTPKTNQSVLILLDLAPGLLLYEPHFVRTNNQNQ